MSYHIVLKTHDHLGDCTALTNVLHNVAKAFPENDYSVEFGRLDYSGLFLNNPFWSMDSMMLKGIPLNCFMSIVLILQKLRMEIICRGLIKLWRDL